MPDVKSNTSPAPKPSPKPEFIVDTIFPARQLHIIGGPAHAGKTALLFRIMGDWQAGLNVFGFKSHPAPFCYVSCVNPLECCTEVMNRMELESIPMISTVDEGGIKTFEDVYARVIREVPNVKVIFLDSILRISDSSGLDNKVVGDFLSGLLRKIKEYGVTVIATGRCAKPKESRSAIRSIDRFLGATAWTEFGATYIAIEPKRPNNPLDDHRVVTVMPKGAAPAVFHYRFTHDGKLVEVSDDITADSADRVESLTDMVSGYTQGEKIPTADLLELCRTLGVVARSTGMKYVSILVRRGELLDAGHGYYKRPEVQ